MSDPTKIHVHTSTDGPCGYCSGDDCPMRYCPGCPPGCPLAEDEPDEDHDHHSDVRPVSPALVSLGYDADSRLCRLLADKAALLGDVDRLTAERDRARGTAVALEAENARLRECVERMASEMQRGRLIPGTPVFGCAACGIPTESEPCRDHDEGLQHAGDMLRALLADAVVGGTSWSVRGISWYEPLKRDTLVPHDHTQRVPGCFRCDLSSLEVPNA